MHNLRSKFYSFFPHYRIFLLSVFWVYFSFDTKAQETVAIKDSIQQHIFSYGEIESLEDAKGRLTFEDIVQDSVSRKFRKSKMYTPKVFNLNSYHWFRIKIRTFPESKEHWILEFFDQTIDEIILYAPDSNNKYRRYVYGDSYPFNNRNYHHKNFTYDIDNSKPVERTFYIRVKSSQSASIIVVLRSIKRFINYASEEYLFFGMFYGMVIVFSLYNLLMFFAVRQKQYLYYILYNLSIGVYEMCADGIAFQFLWPNFPEWNQFSYGVMLYLSSIFALLFTVNFLYLRSKAPFLFKIIAGVIVIRTIFFLFCLFNHDLFSYKIVDLIPLLAALSSGIYIWYKKYKPARFFVIGYCFLLLGVIIKALVFLNVSWLPYGPVTHYSLSFCFVVEMVLVSFAIGDNITHLRKKKDKTQKRMIFQLRENERLKDVLNKELTTLVDQRTKELIEKASIIEEQNQQLNEANDLLKEQAERISEINILLKQDNQELTVNIEKVSKARVMSQEVDFSEFSKIYPDRETCYKFLSELKWAGGYSCRKCNNTNYLSGHLPYSRRCTKCRYEESVIAYTIFQNSRIEINKAFYMLFLIYSSKGKISSHKLSEILSIRQSTCWAYSSKMKKLLDERKKELKNAGEQGWSKLVLQ